MIKKPKFYDNIVVKSDDNIKLKDGYYEGIIKGVKIRTSEINGIKQDILTVFLDIIQDGEYKNFFQKKYDSDARDKKDKRWLCSYDFFLDNDKKTPKENETSARYLKRFLTAVENSNPNFKFNWDENELKDKKVGLGFGLKEFQGNNGKIYTTTELRCFRSLDAIEKIDYNDINKKFDVRNINNVFIKYRDYMEQSNQSKNTDENEEDSYVTVEVDDDDIPF